MKKGILLLAAPAILLINQLNSNNYAEAKLTTYNDGIETDVITLDDVNLTAENNREDFNLDYINKQNRKVTLNAKDININCYTLKSNNAVSNKDISINVLFNKIGNNAYTSTIELDKQEETSIKVIINYNGQDVNENISCDYQIAVNSL